ncbi:hypothetical protein COO60DRAFT_1495919 [Scenedesmus sp. NREL 46B-D3]|nr:hypothetical protein COO60DRAFT_1495919 [Scenedesmus sp. NREL 46B-D3]
MYRHAGTCYVLCLVLLICIFCNRFTAALQPDRSALGVGHLQRTATRKLLLLEQHSIEQHDGSKSGIRTLHQSVRSRAAEPARRRGTPASNSAAGPAPGLGLQCRSYLEVAANVPAVVGVQCSKFSDCMCLIRLEQCRVHGASGLLQCICRELRKPQTEQQHCWNHLQQLILVVQAALDSCATAAGCSTCLYIGLYLFCPNLYVVLLRPGTACYAAEHP